MYLRTLLAVFIILVSSFDASACQLMAASVDKPVRLNHLWQTFRLRGKINNDGWGLAWFTDNSIEIFKEPTSAYESMLAKFLDTYPFMKSTVLIAHVRKASVGSRAFRNTHPFVRYYNGIAYAFIHNGTLHNFRSALKLGRFKPIGTTDSEYLFCYLLGKITSPKITKWTKSDCLWLRQLLREANNAGSMNCIFTNGKYLFCYHDKNNYNTLFYIHRHKLDTTVSFVDIHKRIKLSKLYSGAVNDVLIVATKPLTNEKWTPIKPAELIVVKDGKIIFANDSISK